MNKKINNLYNISLFLLSIISISIHSNEKNNLQDIFNNIYKNNLWPTKNNESVSGPGSTLNRTNKLRAIFPQFLHKYNIRTLIDAPCGDLNWTKEIIYNLNIHKYIGVDIVKELIDINSTKFTAPFINFINLNIVDDVLPKADLILCRDCFIHLSKENIFKAIRKFKESGSKYLLMTHYTNNRTYIDIKNGEFREINFNLNPFNFPMPLDEIKDNENYPSTMLDKCLALWKLEDLNI